VRLIAAAPLPVEIEPAVYASTERRIWPIRRMSHETVFHRVEMRVVHMRRKVPIVAYRVLRVPLLPNAPFSAAIHDL
jgi:hypothetical protein